MQRMSMLARCAAGLLLLIPARLPAQAQPADTVRVAAMSQAGSKLALRPGDVLRLRIWREPDLSGDYPVDEKGTAVLPRLGSTAVTGIPADDLKQQLVERYREYLNNPSIEITALRRVSVIGAVRNPGMFPVEPSVTLGAVANLAGGTTPNAKASLVELRRGTERRQIDLKKHPELATLPLESGDQIYIPERSWLSQNATWFVSTLVGVAGTVAYLVVR
jgi:protein involved in polysaccharide export with SLBB domain